MRLTSPLPPRRIAAVFGVALFCFSTVICLREGMAELTAFRANRLVAQWESGRAPTPSEIELTVRSINTAILLSPGNGDHWESLGATWFARASAQGRSLEGRVRDFDRAADAFREATRRSKVSGYAWANLVIAKHYAGQIDPEFTDALKNAARYAPHEAAVQGMIVFAVLARWTVVNSEIRNLAAQTIIRGFPRHSESLIAEAANSPGREAWCDTALWPRERELYAAMHSLCEATANYSGKLAPGTK